MRTAPIRILGLAGSLRKGSVNTALLRAASMVVQPNTVVKLFEHLAALPMFNEDLEAIGLPPAVQQLRKQVEDADGLLISTPEYNNSIPGVLKNAIDWLSRPNPTRVLVGKPVAVIGATMGSWGTRLAQAALRQVLFSTESLVLPAPGLFVRSAGGLVDSNGVLIDPASIGGLTAVMAGFVGWIDMLRQSHRVVGG